MKFGAKGCSVGPSVIASVRKVEFYCTNSEKNIYRQIELKNTSKASATFQFDIDETQCVFRLNKVCGSISPNKKVRIEITFEPPSPGSYIKQLYCLIKYQCPLVIDAIGLCMSCNGMGSQNINVVRYPQLEVVTGGYGSYIQDCATATDHKPPLTLSTCYLDFGQGDVAGEQTAPSTVSVTNHMKEAATFEWNLDKNGVFSMYPREAVISSEHSALFQAYFQPDKEETIYSIELEGRAYWGDQCKDSHERSYSLHQTHIPIPFSIRMMGHTFPPKSYGWIPQYQVDPQTVVLPACMPPVPAYTTFTIKRLGPMPLMFKFFPPQDTYYTVKPMQGIIKSNFQIVVVQFCPESTEEAAYIERWGLQFNGSSKHETYVDFRAYAEYPSLLFGRANMVYFPPTFPGSEQTVVVPIRNLARHCTRYHYHESEIPKYMEIVDNVGYLAPNEVLNHTWKYTPREPGEYIMRIKCEIHSLQECSYEAEMPKDMTLTAYGYSEYVDMVACPEKIDFGISQCGETRTKTFHLFNFGSCEIHYKLKVVHYALILKSKRLKDISLSPLYSTLSPNERKEVTVTICPSLTGLNEFAVLYDIRINSQSQTTVQKLTDKVLTVIQYEGVFPTLQVHDLKDLQGGPLFGKLLLWKMLNINRLNNALAAAVPNYMKEVTMTMPEATQGTPPITIAILLKNYSDIPNKWEIKRYKNCDCPLLNLDRGISFRRQEYDCPHRPMFQIFPTSGELEPQGKAVLRLVVKYKLEGSWQLKYVIYLSNNRSVMLTAMITVHSLEKPMLSTVERKFKLWDTYIGDEDSFAQVFWIYNNLLVESSYEVDLLPISVFNHSNFNTQVIKCLNPKGDVEPKSNHPILFRFNPLELKGYELSCILKLGNILMSLTISGSGTVKYNSHIHTMRDKMPAIRRFIVPEDQILVSIMHIVINPVPTYTIVHRMLFIENNTEYSVFSYQWHRYEIPGVLEAKVSAMSKSLHPQEAHVCRVTVTTYGQPCLLSFQIKCQLLNITERRNHEKSVLVHAAVERCLEGQFIITEKGTTVPGVDVPIEPVPAPFFIVLTVTCCITNSNTLDDKMPLATQLRQTPNHEKWPIFSQPKLSLTPNEVHIIVSVLEKMIWDVVFSKWFDNLVIQLRNEDTPYYCQFVMEEQERTLLNDLSYIQPSRRLTESILHEIIFELLHEEFTLGPVYKDQNMFDLRRSYRRSDMSTSFAHHSAEDVVDHPRPRFLSEGRIKVPSGW